MNTGSPLCVIEMKINIHSFYAFFLFPDYTRHQTPLLALMEQYDVRGSILLAAEGFNGTIAGEQQAVEAIVSFLKTLPGCPSFPVKASLSEHCPFGRAKIRLKREIVSSGVAVSPATHPTAVRLSPHEWNDLLAQDDVILIDARNAYEIHLGAFQGAVNPQTRNFHQLFDYSRTHLDKKQKIATYCTGGIRCEKYTSWLLAEGFTEVRQLDGGILNYLAEIPPEESRWEGACYVFDERIAVDHFLQPVEGMDFCKPCGHPLSESDRQDPGYIEGKHCPFCDTHPPSNRV